MQDCPSHAGLQRIMTAKADSVMLLFIYSRRRGMTFTSGHRATPDVGECGNFVKAGSLMSNSFPIRLGTESPQWCRELSKHLIEIPSLGLGPSESSTSGDLPTVVLGNPSKRRFN